MYVFCALISIHLLRGSYVKVVRPKVKIYLMRSDLVSDDVSFFFIVFRVQAFPEQSILAAICL